MEGGAACDTLSSSFLEAYRVSFKICQLKTAERQISKVVYYFTDCHPVIAMHYTTNSFNSTRFTHGGGVQESATFAQMSQGNACITITETQLHLKGKSRGWEREVFTARGNVMVMKCQDTGMESS